MINPCTTTRRVHAIIIRLTGMTVVSMAMKMAMLMALGITSMDIRLLAVLSNWMTTTMMICGEPNAGFFAHFSFACHSAFSIFCNLRKYPRVCRSRLFLEACTQAPFPSPLPFSDLPVLLLPNRLSNSTNASTHPALESYFYAYPRNAKRCDKAPLRSYPTAHRPDVSHSAISVPVHWSLVALAQCTAI